MKAEPPNQRIEPMTSSAITFTPVRCARFAFAAFAEMVYPFSVPPSSSAAVG
jgi:hypothetical protein